MRLFLRNTGLSAFFLAIFLASLGGQALVGHSEYNDEEVTHAELLHEQPETISLGRYVRSSSYWNSVMENWQSEYLQFTVFLLATIWFVQRGSTESKRAEDIGLESDEKQRVGRFAGRESPAWARAAGWRRAVYGNSLLLVMGFFFFASWFGQSVTGWSEYNADQIEHQAEPVNWLGYVTGSNFWEATLQNWQSEFLAVGSMVVLSIFLRQRGSPESKPVGAAHDETSVEG